MSIATPKCQPNPCLNGGGCTPSPSAHVGYICSCQQGYTGMNCEHTDGKLLSEEKKYSNAHSLKKFL